MTDGRGAGVAVAVAGVVAGAGAVVGAGGCGAVRFVPSPYTPQAVEIAYAPSEDLTVVRWFVRGEAPSGEVIFERALADGTFAPIDFAAAPYPSGVASCADGSCGALALRGHYAPPPGLSPIRTRHARYGLFPGTPPRNRIIDPSISVSARFLEGNRSLAADVRDDLLGQPPLARPLAWSLVPLDAGDCARAPAAPDAGPVVAGSNALAAPAALSAGGRYCVVVHGVPSDGGSAPVFATLALTFPETVRGLLDYLPPVEKTPLLVQIILDLQTADATRCAEIHQALLGTLRGALRAADPAPVEFPLLDLAPDCNQDPFRSIDPPAIADPIKVYVHDHPVWFNRPLLFYANNQSIVPDQLQAELAALPAQFSNDARFQTYFWGMTLAGAAPAVPFDLVTYWIAIEAPDFVRTVSAPVAANLPFETELHQNDRMVPLLDDATVAAEAGGLLKLCEASPASVVLAQAGVPAGGVVVSIEPAAPPGFFVAFPVWITVPRQSFVQDEALLRYEICRRFCDHPFPNPAGLAQPSWRTSSECVHNRVP